MFALDTTTVIDFFRERGNVKQNLLSQRPADILIPSVVLFELEYGLLLVNSRRKKEQFQQFTSYCGVLGFGGPEARAAAKIKRQLEETGQGIGPMDTLIAGTAMAGGLILVTHNTREFGRIRGLQIEDWY